jgi:hypothetical protein
MRLALLPALILTLAACGSSSPRHAHPKNPPPGAGRGAPPPAWIETRAGDRWLGYSSFCWNHPVGNSVAHACADFGAPKCSQRQVPSLSVEKGEKVRAHLGFTPLEASVDNANARLEDRSVEWRIEQPGPFLLFTRAKDADASYVGCGVFP